MSFQFDAERIADDGLLERKFAFEEDGERVPGLLWTQPGAAAPRPLVLAGHGFGVDKRFAFPAPSLRALALEHGCAVAILDAPCHGERRADPAQGFEATTAAYQQYWQTYAGSRIAREYAAAARWLRGEGGLGVGPIGYWGLSLATQYGLAYLARKAREPDADVRAAVLGLFRRGRVVAHYAARVRCPVFFVLQQQDEIHPREDVEALYAEIAGEENVLASSPGAHVEVPEDVFRRAREFLLRHLGVTAPA